MEQRSYSGSPFTAANNRQNSLNQRYTSPSAMQGWGAPARGYSPYTCNFARPQRSPRDNNISPVNKNFHQRSPRTQQNQYRYPSPNEPRSFNNPNFMPFSPPRSGDRSLRGTPHTRYQGRNSFNNSYGKSPRHDCNPGASSNIESYYHPEMLEDPWKNCKAVSVKSVCSS